MPLPLRRLSPSLPDKIRAILAARGLTLADVARASRSGSPGNRLHHLPHNFYYAIRKRGFSPSLYQVMALSAHSGYRFVDWLETFGFSLDDVSRFQVSFPAVRTVELDSRIYHPGSPIPWFQDLKRQDFSVPLVPLSRWLTAARPRRFDALPSASNAAFRFAKIGSQDTFAFPDLVPGSIVRVILRPKALQQIPVGKTLADRLFLVEHSRGLACSRLHRTELKKAILCSRHLPYAPVELEEGTQASVLGVADLEIRPIINVEKPLVPSSLGRFWTPDPLSSGPRPRNVGEFIRRARRRSGLSFREASRRTRTLAETLGDSRYFCAPGSLSDYETRKLPPRHIHKLISICAVYFASAASMLEASGLRLDRAGELPLPSQFFQSLDGNGASQPGSASSRFLEEIARRFGPLPYFLHKAVPSLFGLPDISIRDVFWTGGVKRFLHPYLTGAVLLVVNRKKKSPRSALSSPVRAQPLYVLERRDGAYLCGSCSLHEGSLFVRPSIPGFPKLLRLRNRVDAEVVGKVVGIVRKLS